MSGFLLLDNFQSFRWLYMNLFMFATLLWGNDICTCTFLWGNNALLPTLLWGNIAAKILISFEKPQKTSLKMCKTTKGLSLKVWYFTTSRTKKCKNCWYASAHTSCFLSMLGRPADCSEQTCWLGSAELLSLVATFQKQSPWTPYSISLNLIRRLLSLAQSYSSAYGAVSFG